MSLIDPRALVSPRAHLAPGVRVDAFAVVGENVSLGEGSRVLSHAVLSGPARFGRDNIVHPFASLGGPPQDLKYRGEPTELHVGDGNSFREGVTVNRGTAGGGGVTRIGNANLFMAQAHVAHDCQVGNHTIFANAATLAGHVTVEDYATIGAFSAVHQFCRVGRHAYVGGFTVVTQDVPPFAKTVTPRNTRNYGVNAIGLERRGFSPQRIAVIEKAFRILLRSRLNTTQALEQMRSLLGDSADVAELIRFIEAAERGIVKS
jgi:UDP-N-acetylglucosamine acyltransferase